MTEPARTSRKGFILKAIVGLAITVGLVAFLLRYIEPQQIGRLVAETDWLLWLAGLGLWILMYLVRTVRFVLLAPKTPYLTMLCIASVHNFLLRLLPMRTGDLSYAYLVKRAGTAGLGESLLGLLLLRALDATVVVVIFSITLALDQGTYLGDRHTGLVAAGVAALLGIVLVVLMGRALRLGLRLAAATARLFGVDGSPRIQGLLEKIESSIEAFSRIGTAAKAKVSAASIVLWLLTFAAFFAIMRGFSMPVDLAQTVLGSTAAVVTGFLPIGGIGSFGTLEAGWALGFALVGLSEEQAVVSGFGVSLTTFTYAAVLGLIGWIGLGIIGKRKRQ